MKNQIKSILRSTLRKLGYQIRRLPEGLEFDAAKMIPASEPYTQWETPYPLFSPWTGHPDFSAFCSDLKPYTLVSNDRLYMILSFARYARNIPGDFAECGVYKGGTSLLLARVLDKTRKRLRLFDSFLGLPKEDPKHDNYWSQGSFADTSLHAVQALLKEHLAKVETFQGWTPDTFKDHAESEYAFVHIDVDLYRPALDCCEYFYPRLARGGVMLLDDYGFPACRGEKEAVDQFFADKTGKPICLPTGQALLVKSPPGGEA